MYPKNDKYALAKSKKQCLLSDLSVRGAGYDQKWCKVYSIIQSFHINPIHIPLMNTPKKQAAQKSPEKKGFTLKVVVFGFTLAAALAPLGLFGLYSYNNTTIQVVEKVNGDLLDANAANARLVKSWIDGNVAAVQAVASLPTLESMDIVAIKPVLEAVNGKLTAFYTFNLSDTTGMHVVRSSPDKLINVGDRGYFKRIAVENQPFAIESGISRANNQPFIAFSAPAKREGQTVGVLAALATLKPITDQVTGGKIGKSGYSYLVETTNGTVLGHPIVELVGKKLTAEQITKAAKVNFGKVNDGVGSNGAAVKVSATPIGSDLVLVSEIPAAEIDGPIQEAQINALSFMAGAFLLASILAFTLARNISTKIERLAGFVTNVSRAKGVMEISTLEKKISAVGGARELKTIAAAILRLTGSIKLAMRSA